MMPALLKNRDVLLALIVATLVLLVGLRAPVFLTAESLISVLTDTSFLFMLALAQMAVILTRGIDLSVAANLALSGVMVTLAARSMPWLPIPVVLLLAIAIGAFFGAINGALIAGIGIPPIVVTLGTLSIYRGIIFVVAGPTWLTSKDMSTAFLDFPKSTLLGVPSLIVIAATVAAAFAYLLSQTQTGRRIYAVGGNPVAARYCGIDLSKQQFLVYTMSGAVSGLCGFLWASRYGIAYTDLAYGYELTVIAACVIGGVSVAGGIGRRGEPYVNFCRHECLSARCGQCAPPSSHSSPFQLDGHFSKSRKKNLPGASRTSDRQFEIENDWRGVLEEEMVADWQKNT